MAEAKLFQINCEAMPEQFKKKFEIKKTKPTIVYK